LTSSNPAPDTSLAWANPRLAGRIPELDGIRGLAITLVLTLHYLVEIAWIGSGWLGRSLLLLRLSWSGVDLFFVLSGFLIGGILLDAKYAAAYYRTFYVRRFYRIVPLYVIWLGLFFAGVYWTGPNGPNPLIETFNRSLPLWSYPLFLQTVFMASHATFGTGWMGVTWSLAVEEQFYLLFPLAIRRLSPKAIVRFAVGMVLFPPVLRLVLQYLDINGIANFVLLPCRADALGYGVLAAIACRNRSAWLWLASHRGYLRAAFAVLAFGMTLWTLQDSWLMAHIGFAWLAAFYTSLLLLVVVNPGPTLRRVFTSKVLVGLGTIAYPVYLFHSGMLRLFHYLFFRASPAIRSFPTLCVTVLSLAAVLLMSFISWRILERPLIRHAHPKYRY
jgi:peptidoglycan/LPS O-acetylase OafA/YrhL